MTEILSRNEEGEVDAGGAKFKVPPQQSAISVIGRNPYQDGDDFRDDYWVYQNGKRVRKWFTGHPLKRTWPPGLASENAERIEALYWRTNKRAIAYWKENVFALALSAIGKGSKNKWGEYIIDVPSRIDHKERFHFSVGKRDDEEGGHLGINWRDKSRPLSNADIGDKLWKQYSYSNNLWSRTGKLEVALEHCIRNRIENNKDRFEDNSATAVPTRVVVNEHSYWFTVLRRRGWMDIQRLHWPAHDVVEL